MVFKCDGATLHLQRLRVHEPMSLPLTPISPSRQLVSRRTSQLQILSVLPLAAWGSRTSLFQLTGNTGGMVGKSETKLLISDASIANGSAACRFHGRGVLGPYFADPVRACGPRIYGNQQHFGREYGGFLKRVRRMPRP